jgi:hypothetical protein
MSSAAITGSFCDYKFVKTRGVLQIIVEISVEQQAQAFAALGYPMPGTEIPVAIARLKDSGAALKASERRSASHADAEGSCGVSGSLPPDGKQQAMERARKRAIMHCKDPKFQQWICGLHVLRASEQNAATCLRKTIYGSRSLIATDERCYEAFLELEQEYRRCTE